MIKLLSLNDQEKCLELAAAVIAMNNSGYMDFFEIDVPQY